MHAFRAGCKCVVLLTSYYGAIVLFLKERCLFGGLCSWCLCFDMYALRPLACLGSQKLQQLVGWQVLYKDAMYMAR